ncbi:MAG TPA: heme exporter protein CcmD [Albitalea sp.]
MNWGSAEAFFEMGGYGLYVWGSYVVTLLLMVVEPWLAARRKRRAAARAQEAAEMMAEMGHS